MNELHITPLSRCNLRLMPLLLFGVLFFIGELLADELQGEIRFQPAREAVVWVGQEVELNLDLISTGFSFSGQQFSAPEVSGAYLLQADSNTVKLSENRGGETWQGLRYSFLLYPQREGSLEIPGFEVRFSASAGFGQEPVSFRFETEPLRIETRMPPGADRRGLLVTSSDFSVKAEWKPPQSTEGTTQLKVGDALTLSVTRRAAGVPGMVFSPLPDFALDGLQDYHNASQVNDQINRGVLVGVRSDSVTFICEREGSYQIPGLRFQWWDPDSEVLNEETTPDLVLEVIPNPAFSTSAVASDRRPYISWQYVLLAAPVLILLIIAGQRAAGFVSRWTKQMREERESGEAWAFRQALKACSSARAPDTYQAITIWLSRFEPVHGSLTMLQLAQDSGMPELCREAERLQHAVAQGADQGWNGARLGALLRDLRNSADRQSSSQSELPSLNP